MDLIYKDFSCIFLIIIYLSFTISNHIKGLDDSILFHINWPGNDESLLQSPNYEKIEMITGDKEKFQCLVPIRYGKILDDGEEYKGLNALSLLMPLFKKNTCTLRLESYWTYELCHGRHIKQYHEEKDDKASRYQEYSLGETSMEKLQEHSKLLEESLLKNPNPDIPYTKIEGTDMPYFPINYTDGAFCDLTASPRVSRVLYVCYEEGRHAVYSIKETSTCEYEVIVLTSLLCEHPSYRPQSVPQTDLHCVSMQSGVKRPQKLLNLEAESLKLRTHGASISGDISGGTIQIGLNEEDADSEVETIFSETLHKPIPQTPFPLHPFVDRELVEAFLKGEHCLQGGTGWWKYAFCYGKLVDQYHDNDDGTKIVINLGKFDIEAHKQWIEKNPSKKFRMGKSYVSHFYSDGDICEAIGAPRQVEVKLKCKESISPTSVTLYLLEPKTCEYVLGVETSLVCPLLNTADEVGLFSLDKTQVDDVIKKIDLKIEDSNEKLTSTEDNIKEDNIETTEEEVKGDE